MMLLITDQRYFSVIINGAFKERSQSNGGNIKYNITEATLKWNQSYHPEEQHVLLLKPLEC